MQASSENTVNNETRLFWQIASELRSAKTDKMSDAQVLGLLDELEIIALNTDNAVLARRCRAELARFGEEAATATGLA